SSFMGLFGIVKYLFALFMANPILLVLAAVAGAAYLIVENWEQVKSYLSGVWNWLKEKAEWLGSVFSKIFIGFLDWIKGIFEKIPFIGKALKDEINSIDSDIELKNSLANKSYPQGAYNYNEDRYNQPVYIYEDDEDESGIYQPMLPNSGSIINNASSTENRITQNFNVNITGTTDNEDLLNRFSGYVRQNTGGVIR
ncbi:MAG: hypothetical protein J1F17_04195, partial [Oscillospiraceae bacterium]|nr:hypothetical protein [Oscillospiraceae bacterium]